MRRHTLIGERIVAAAPALGAVAQLVRASHEHWDGGGYPDSAVVYYSKLADLKVSDTAYVDIYKVLTENSR